MSNNETDYSDCYDDEFDWQSIDDDSDVRHIKFIKPNRFLEPATGLTGRIYIRCATQQTCLIFDDFRDIAIVKMFAFGCLFSFPTSLLFVDPEKALGTLHTEDRQYYLDGFPINDSHWVDEEVNALPRRSASGSCQRHCTNQSTGSRQAPTTNQGETIMSNANKNTIKKSHHDVALQAAVMAGHQYVQGNVDGSGMTEPNRGKKTEELLQNAGMVAAVCAEAYLKTLTFLQPKQKVTTTTQEDDGEVD